MVFWVRMREDWRTPKPGGSSHGSWKAPAPSLPCIGTVNRSESPSPVLRTPSPPLGERDGVRGSGSRKVVRLESRHSSGKRWCVEAGFTGPGLRGRMSQCTGAPVARHGFVTRYQPVQKPDDPPRVTGHGLLVGDNDDGVALLREF